MVARLSRLVPLEPLLLALFVIERTAVLAAAGALARTLAPSSWLAPIAAMALFGFAIDTLLGNGTIVDPYFEQTGVAMVFLLFAAAAFYARRAFLWGICLGLGFASNGLYGLFAASYFSAAIALDAEARRAWRRWAGGLVPFAATASWEAARGLGSIAPSAGDDALWLAAIRARCWQHLYPLSWRPIHFERFGLLVAILLAVGLGARRRAPRLFRAGLIWLAVALAWIAAAFLAAYVLRWPALLMLQPARATDLFVAFAATAIVALCASEIEDSGANVRRSGATWALIATLLIWRPAGSWAALAAAGLLGVPPLGRAIRGRSAALVAAGLLGVWIFAVGGQGFRERLDASKSLYEALVSHPDPWVHDVAGWAAVFTSRDAVFLVNLGAEPDWDQFRGLSGRSIFTNWEEGTAINWDRPFVRVWSERLQAAGFDVTRRWKTIPEDELDRISRNLRDPAVLALASRFRIDFWIVPEAHPSALPAVFRADGYKVLRVH